MHTATVLHEWSASMAEERVGYMYVCALESSSLYIVSGVARGGAQGARAPPSALGLVNIVHRTASSSTPLATPNHQLL